MHFRLEIHDPNCIVPATIQIAMDGIHLGFLAGNRSMATAPAYVHNEVLLLIAQLLEGSMRRYETVMRNNLLK